MTVKRGNCFDMEQKLKKTKEKHKKEAKRSRKKKQNKPAEQFANWHAEFSQGICDN